jgi:hypothetical protein
MRQQFHAMRRITVLAWLMMRGWYCEFLQPVIGVIPEFLRVSD